MMRKIISLLIVLVFILCSCNIETNDNEKSPKPTKTQDNSDTSIPNSDKYITMIMKNSLLNNNDELMGEYASELLSEEGFNVEIKFFNINYQEREYSIEKYKNFIRDEISTGKNVFFETGFDISELDAEGLIFDTDIDVYSPEIAIGSRQILSYTGVFIDAKLEVEYGKAIKSTADYEDFLIWASQNASDKLPGCIILDGGIGESYSPLALFAQENGYARADKSIGSIGEGLITYYIKTDEIANAIDVPPTVHRAVDLPLFYDMDLKINKWKSNGYIDIKGISELTDTSDYSSIVMSTYNTNEYYSFDYRSPRYKMIDVSDFNLHIFTEDGVYSDSPLLSKIDYSSKFAISAKSPAPEDIAELIHWIYSSFDNYMLFMCGKEGVDYDIDDNKLSFKVNDLGITYGLWYKHISFVDPEMGLDMPHFPANWEEINSIFSNLKGISITKVIGNENLPGNLSEIVYQTVFDETLRSEYNDEVASKYTKYFFDLKKNEPKYLASDLISELKNSKIAIKKKEAYEDFIDAILGN